MIDLVKKRVSLHYYEKDGQKMPVVGALGLVGSSLMTIAVHTLSGRKSYTIPSTEYLCLPRTEFDILVPKDFDVDFPEFEIAQEVKV